MNQVLRIESLQEFIRIVLELKTKWTDAEEFDPWFRGQRDGGWALVPKLFRARPGVAALPAEVHNYHDESEIQTEFRRRGSQLVQGREPQDDWDWYFLMQHYGAPTRLLDWTDGALIALYFAVKSETYEIPAVDAAVWMLDPWWLNQTILKNPGAAVMLKEWMHDTGYLPKPYSTKVLIPRYPVAIDPPHVAQRLAAQHGHFTIHGSGVNAFEELISQADSHVAKITIDKNSTVGILKDLETCGIVETTVFPDLQALGFEMCQLLCRLAAE